MLGVDIINTVDPKIRTQSLQRRTAQILDWRIRKAKLKEALPDFVMDEVLLGLRRLLWGEYTVLTFSTAVCLQKGRTYHALHGCCMKQDC